MGRAFVSFVIIGAVKAILLLCVDVNKITCTRVM